ncbi:MAG: Riboflavin biosynthesis protein RibF [bacterium ADurb.Bin429]|nr:MAG: Riboflavin biosynthesis protein RibF [bacterium ADurb.Bin429]
MHRGHQALLHSCRRRADALRLPAVALTYDPHPLRVLHPDAPVRLLTPVEEKLRRLQASAIDEVIVTRFTHDFSLLSPEEFLRAVVDALHPRAIVVGYRTTFGRDRAGTADVLRDFGARTGIEIEVVPPVEIRGMPVSSSLIRRTLEEGNVEEAAELLGYRYMMGCAVTRGDGRGRLLGMPTANLEPEPEKLVPADGVYAVTVAFCEGTRRGVMSIGSRPTFHRPHALEVHLLDYDGDLYGQTLEITFLRRLRDICTFPNADLLMARIREDIIAARAF